MFAFFAGMYHFGVVKCLFEHNVLPRVICGASIGALVTCLFGMLASHSSDPHCQSSTFLFRPHTNTGSKTDDEIRTMLSDPEPIKFTSFQGRGQPVQ
jgi:predicted acylesterase/phospholipase RssA